MKGGIAAGLCALAALEDLGVEPNIDVAIELVVAEETTGVGTRAAALEVPDPVAALILEPTGGAIVPIGTSLQFFTVEVTGRSAHTSAPWRGVDAFERLIWVRESLVELGRKRGEGYRHPLFADVPTAIPFAIGTASAGNWRAAVPDHATMSGRIGVAPGEPVAAVRGEFQRVLDQVAATDDWLRAHPPTVRWDGEGRTGWETPVEHELIVSLRDAHRVRRGGRGGAGRGSARPRPARSDRARPAGEAGMSEKTVASADGTATAKVLSRQLGIKLGTCYHLLRTLLASGYVVRLPGGRYDVGHRAASLNRHLQRRSGPSPELAVILTRLHNMTHETSYISGWHHGTLTLQQYISGLHAVSVGNLDVGYTGHMHARASCKAVLAFLPEEQVAAMFKGVELAAVTPRTIVDYDHLTVELARVRRQSEPAYPPDPRDARPRGSGAPRQRSLEAAR